MNVLAIIPARGGSKRVPRKNVRPFCGKPIICYSIDAAFASGVFGEVMVSTDDEEIAEISRKAGASIPFMRSQVTANDSATISNVIAEVLHNYHEMGKTFDYYAIIYATAPMIKAEYLRDAFQVLKNSGEGFLLPVVKYSYPPQRSYAIENGLLHYNFPEAYAIRTQDLDAWYHDCGLFSMAKTEAFYNTVPSERKKIPFVLNDDIIQDIDNENDWRIAEMKFKLLQNSDGERME